MNRKCWHEGGRISTWQLLPRSQILLAPRVWGHRDTSEYQFYVPWFRFSHREHGASDPGVQSLDLVQFQCRECGRSFAKSSISTSGNHRLDNRLSHFHQDGMGCWWSYFHACAEIHTSMERHKLSVYAHLCVRGEGWWGFTEVHLFAALPAEKTVRSEPRLLVCSNFHL